jgi:2-oxoglutarate ferredoxin oxidoreductase subunit beta
MKATVFKRPQAMTTKPMHYCPGCGHGIIHRLVAEVIDELGIRDNTVGTCPVGCAVVANEYFNVDMQQAAHGRSPAVATGIKRCLPHLVVFTYQGDGDLASIGVTEIVHAAARGELITTIFVNNAIYGMTGGQMAPTSLLGQVTTTTPLGRKKETQGSPIRVAEMLATLEGAAYIARTSVHNAVHVMRTKRAIRQAFETQIEGKGFSMVEILSTCPTNWGLSPVESMEWLAEKMIPYYPLGEIKKTEIKND